jgi:GNAT superfamily N-acetyltransferase
MTIAGIHVRPACADDAVTLATLRYRFRTEVGEPVETEEGFVERAAPWIAERLAGAAWRAWVAMDTDGEIVGHVFVQFVEKIPNPVPEAETLGYLTNLYVAPPLRNQGIGALLLQAALAACDEMGVETVFLRPSAGSVPLYRRHGFTDAALLERPTTAHPTAEH